MKIERDMYFTPTPISEIMAEHGDRWYAASVRRKEPLHLKEIPEVDFEAACPVCGGPGMRMGGLGRKQWFRCRNCGMEWSLPYKLPTFRGYTVDERLREFRKMELGQPHETIPFDSPEGREMLQQMQGG